MTESKREYLTLQPRLGKKSVFRAQLLGGFLYNFSVSALNVSYKFFGTFVEVVSPKLTESF